MDGYASNVLFVLFLCSMIPLFVVYLFQGYLIGGLCGLVMSFFVGLF